MYSKKANIILSFFTLAVFTLSACSQDAPKSIKNEPSVLLGQSATTIIVPAPIAPQTELISGLEAGNSAVLLFDRCPDTEEFKKANPLGTLICGQEYKVFWDTNKTSWTVIGPNHALPKGEAFDITAAIYPGTPPSMRKIVVWGVGITINANYEASTETFGVVGTLKHVGSPKLSPQIETPTAMRNESETQPKPKSE